MVRKRKISLVLADVDGTLVNEEKVLTERAQSAIGELRRAGIRFAITSGRPPLGMAMQKLAHSLAASFETGVAALDLPLRPSRVAAGTAEAVA